MFVADQPKQTREEIVRINDDARPEALQFGLLVPLAAAVLGLIASIPMMRLPDPVPSDA